MTVTAKDGNGAQATQSFVWTVFPAPAIGTGTGGATGPITGYQGLCLDDRSASTANYNPIQVYTCNGTNAQQWTVESNNTLQALGKCLDVDRRRNRQRHPGRPLHLQRHRGPGLAAAVQRRTGQPQLRQVSG